MPLAILVEATNGYPLLVILNLIKIKILEYCKIHKLLLDMVKIPESHANNRNIH